MTMNQSLRYKPGMYIGIDLGTTNTVLSRCLVSPSGDLMRPETIRIPQQTDEYGNTEEREKLSSAVFIDEEGQVIPGEYAQKRLMSRRDVDDVIAWWKNYIGLQNGDGKSRTWQINGKTIHAKDAASYVLQHVREKFDMKYPGVRVSPVVTVPASFPEQMKRATLEAIQEAGWMMDEQQPTLLYEPIAALIAYLSWYEAEQMPLPPEERSPDLSQGGRVLVFDIGGGTVDVTLARLEAFTASTGQSCLRACVEDYAPHTLLGGYRFDSLFAEGMLQYFCKEYGITPDALSREESDELYNTFLEWSESAKIGLTSGQDSVSRRLSIPPSLRREDGRKIATITINKEDYFQHIKPLLGEHLQIKSELPSSESRHIGEADTIVEPIIRLMQRNHLQPQDLRGCLLVGGMAYLPAIRERLAKLFEHKTPLLWGQIDPLNAVTFGAAIHNAQILNGLSPHMVAVRPVDIRVYDGKTKQPTWVNLINKGRFLPYGEVLEAQSPTLLFPRGQREIKLKLRYGGVSRRGLSFSYPEELSNEQERAFRCFLRVDSHTHILHLRASLLDFPEVHIDISFDETPEQAEMDEPEIVAKPLPAPAKVLPPSTPQQPQDPNEGTLIDLPSSLMYLQKAADSRMAAQWRKALEKAANVGILLPQMVSLLQKGDDLSSDGRAHLVILLGRIYARYTFGNAMNPKTDQDTAKKLRGALGGALKYLQNLLFTPYLPNELRKNAAFSLGLVGLLNTSLIKMPKLLAEAAQVDVINQKNAASIQTEIFRAIGRTLQTKEDWLVLLRSWHNHQHVSLLESSCWAMARILTRDPLLLKITEPSHSVQTLYHIQQKALNHSNPSVQIMGWNAVALFSMTADIGLSEPVYAASQPALLDSLHQLALRLLHSPLRVNSSIKRGADFFLRAIQGQAMAQEMIYELEDLPILR